MELKSVEIAGFKSFADKLTLTFNGGITAIVGPNGSGKSNVSDAIRWVLGEQSAKSLRGAKMEDVIFAGTERRRPVNFAQVTLTLDNRDRSLASEYDEVAISRKMYRSGESEYLINGVRCRLRDVQELLMDTGIGKDGYSIIGQGRIDQLLSNKPQDRRMIFEEAAGIVKFKVRREEANKQLLEEQGHLQRVSDILEEASSRLTPLENQARSAKAYLELTQELKGLEVQSFIRQYRQLSDQLEGAQDKLIQLNHQLEEAKAAHQNLREKAQLCEKDAQRSASDLSAAIQEQNDLRVRRESQDGERKLQLQQIEQLRRERRGAKERLEDARSRLARRRQTYEKEQEQLAELYTNREAQEAQQALLQHTESQIQEEFTNARTSLEECERQLEQARQELEQAKDMAARQEVMAEQEQDHHGDIQQRLDLLAREAEEKRQDAAERRDCLVRAQTEYETRSREIEALTDEISSIRQELHQAQERQNEAQQAVQQLQSRIRWLRELEREYEGYAGSVKVIMQQKAAHPDQYTGVLGTVADLIQVPERLSTAVEIALGGAVQNIVTDSSQTAKKLIEYLRERKAGRATFQPLDNVSARTFQRNEKVLGMPGVIGYADELIQYDGRYRNIFSRLLGNVIVAENFENASAVSKQYGAFVRVVTLKGDLFHTGGSITGGSTGGKTAVILNRKGELDTLEKELVKVRENGRKWMEEAAALAKKRQEMTEQMSQLSQSKEEAAHAAAQRQSEYDQSEVMLQMIQTQLSEAKKNKEALAQSLQENRQSLEKMHSELEEKQRSFEAYSLQVQTQKEQWEAGRQRREEMHGQLMRIKIELSTTQQLIASMEHSIEREQQDMEQDEQEIRRYQEQLSHSQNEEKNLESGTMQSEAELGEVGRLIEQMGERIEVLTREQEQKEELRRTTVQESEEAVHLVSDLEKEQYRLDAQVGRAKKELSELQDRIWEKYELTYNAALKVEAPCLESQAAAGRRISELKNQIKDLGPVNIHAVEEYETLLERCQFLRSQLDDVRKAEESLRDIIRQLTEQMENQFREGFGKISDQFNRVFQKMFGGGRGMLRLEEESNPLESGIDIVAQPPGKTLKNMTALSGGERALTAIAILFAIQQLKPAPFCILDEIEAALDDANVNRYADFLKTLCTTTQFIVITHRKGTMEAASTMYGITMEEKGVSKCISVKFE